MRVKEAENDICMPRIFLLSPANLIQPNFVEMAEFTYNNYFTILRFVQNLSNLVSPFL